MLSKTSTTKPFEFKNRILRLKSEKHEAERQAIIYIEPKPNDIPSYTWVASHPKLCCDRIYVANNVMTRKTAKRLRQLAFNSHNSIRNAAIHELDRRAAMRKR